MERKRHYLKRMKPPLPVLDEKVSLSEQCGVNLAERYSREAERTGIPYQTLLNSKLRESMNLPDHVQTLVEEILARKRAS
jgi:hypothetical protein